MTDRNKTADMVLALVHALTACGRSSITRSKLAETIAAVADFRGETFHPDGFRALLDRMDLDDEIEIFGYPERITIGRKCAGWEQA
ncbi:hypothetical protein AB0M02_42210 [Actinoplanes sp. NPDC051861]|uniref:hypothetical protein n=1 Tax=Actinoplanes sp. NPDC051861 TaxID=3155170 RepID=UPI00343E3A4E